MITGLEPLRGDRDFPGIGRQAKHFTKAMLRAGVAAISLKPVIVPPEIELQRQLICTGCDENRSGRCKVCGCGVSAQFIRKTNLATEQCPLPVPKWLRWKPS